MPNPIITKADFPQYVEFSLNTLDKSIDPHIKAMQTFDLISKLPENLLAALYNMSAVAPDPGPDPTPELRAFYTNFIVQYCVLLAYDRFIAKQGINVTQFGLTQTKDPAGTFDQVPEERRSVIMRGNKSDANVLLSLINKELARVKYTFDGIVFGTAPVAQSTPSVTGVNAIRNKSTRPNRNALTDYINGIY